MMTLLLGPRQKRLLLYDYIFFQALPHIGTPHSTQMHSYHLWQSCIDMIGFYINHRVWRYGDIDFDFWHVSRSLEVIPLRKCFFSAAGNMNLSATTPPTDNTTDFSSPHVRTCGYSYVFRNIPCRRSNLGKCFVYITLHNAIRNTLIRINDILWKSI